MEKDIDYNSILSRFSPEFRDKINTNPFDRTIFELLCQGGDIYKIMEDVLELYDEVCKDHAEFLQKQSPTIIIKKEDYDRAKKGT